MRKLIYTSRESEPFDRGRLLDLLADARSRNGSAELSGLLIYADGSFLQLLEGPDDAVGATYARIVADPRHQALRVLADEPAVDRRFPDWAMGFESVGDDELARALPGYRATPFPLADPGTITDAALAEALLAIYRGS